MKKSPWKAIDDMTKRALVSDPDLNNFLTPFLPNKMDRRAFIRQCLRKLKTRRMLLRSQWYTELADRMHKVREGRDGLRLIFLMGMAEGVTKQKLGTNHIGSLDAILRFFRHISPEDKTAVRRGIRRALVSARHHKLLFSSIVRILYEVRNEAVHGEDFYSFSLLNPREKKKHIEYMHFGLITSGSLGKAGFTKRGNRRRKRRVALDISMTYPELRNMMVRTAIANIRDAM